MHCITTHGDLTEPLRQPSRRQAGVKSRATGALMLVLFFALLIGLPLLAALTPAQSLKEFDAFYRAGSLVFGGGHVVLPLLQASVVSLRTIMPKGTKSPGLLWPGLFRTLRCLSCL